MKRDPLCVAVTAIGAIVFLVDIIATILIIAIIGTNDTAHGCGKWYRAMDSDILWGNNISTVRSGNHRDDCLIFLNTHSHTVYSDGKYDPEGLIVWHIRHRFNSFVVTDHGTFDGYRNLIDIARSPKYAESIVVLPGFEWTTVRFHMNVVFPPNATLLDEYSDEYRGYMNLNQIKSRIHKFHDAGAVVIWNHPKYYALPPEGQGINMTEALYVGVDCIEVVNSVELFPEEKDFALANDLCIVAGVDIHEKNSVNRAYTIVRSHDFTEYSVFEKLKARETLVSDKGWRPHTLW